MISRIKIVSIFLIIFGCIACSYKDNLAEFKLDYNKRIPNEVAKRDLQSLKAILQEAQTSLYTYTTPEALDSVFNTIHTFKEDSISYLDLIRRITRYQNTIACGHSGWGHPRAFKTYRNIHMRFFPLNISIRNQKYFIQDTYTPLSYSLNDVEILEINNTPVKHISKILKQHMVKDGYSNRDGLIEVEKYFKIAYSNFIDNPEEFQLKIDRDGHIQHVKINALSLAKIDSLHPIEIEAKLSLEEKQVLSYQTYKTLNTGLLTIKSFRNEYIEYFGQEFTPYIDSIFNTVHQQKLEALIIDLRGNTGGWTANGKHLFSYFINQPMEYIKKVEIKKHDNFSFDSLITSPPGYLDTFNLVKNETGVYEWKNYPSLTVNPQTTNNFKGYVYILIDEMSKSCSAVFSAMMQDHTNAVLVGKETGASKCSAGGIATAIELPLTRIPIHFSTAKYYPNVNNLNNCRGIQPDITINNTTTITEDKELNFILDLIEKTK